MKAVIIGSVLVLLIVIALVLVTQNNQKEPEFKFSEPVEVVKKYFDSWDKKNWVEMYASISDGFKKIEPTAQTLVSFKQYAEAQNIPDVKILSIEEKSNNGKTAIVDYSVEFSALESGSKFNGTFILKFRQGDIIKGWKLIHPYGPNIDTS